MKKIVVIGATGTLGQAVSAELKARHEVIEVGATRGQYHVDSTDPASIERLFREIGKVDGVVTATGKVHFGPLPEMTVEQFWVGLRDKLMGQINVVLVGQQYVNDGGSFTLTSGILTDEPIREGANATTVNLALEGFVRGAAIECGESNGPHRIARSVWAVFPRLRSGDGATCCAGVPAQRGRSANGAGVPGRLLSWADSGDRSKWPE
jgi:NAD(P)-dependent dehydrogenase (short-subunit alcohol dehydrogenase family)